MTITIPIVAFVALCVGSGLFLLILAVYFLDFASWCIEHRRKRDE